MKIKYNKETFEPILNLMKSPDGWRHVIKSYSNSDSTYDVFLHDSGVSIMVFPKQIQLRADVGDTALWLTMPRKWRSLCRKLRKAIEFKKAYSCTSPYKGCDG